MRFCLREILKDPLFQSDRSTASRENKGKREVQSACWSRNNNFIEALFNFGLFPKVCTAFLHVLDFLLLLLPIQNELWLLFQKLTSFVAHF